MSRPGWIDPAVLLLLAVLAGCATSGARRPVAAPADSGAPATALLADYESALARLQAGDAAGVSQLERLAASHPQYAGPALNLGIWHARQRQDAVALGWLERAAAVCERCGPVWNEVGVVERRQGNFSKAEAAWRRAIEVEPGYALPYYNLAVLFELYRQQPGMAAQFYRDYLEREPGADPSVTQRVADLERRSGTTPTAARAGDKS
jgi:Flp pilus assembly protein TadD